MTTIATVWDRTVLVMRARAGILTVLAVLTVLLPAVASGAFRGFVAAGSGAARLALPISLAVFVLLVLGMLAMTAVASDPAVDRAAALRIAARRFGAALAVLAAMMALALLIFLPAGLAMGLSGATMTPDGSVNLRGAATNTVALAGAFVLAALVAGLWLTAKMVPLFPVVVNERRGLRAIARSFRLTRGATLRLMGVLLLYAIVLLVAASAVQAVAGVIARLLFGWEADGAVALAVATAGAAVTALATVVQTVFYAQFYAAVIDRAAGGRDGDGDGDGRNPGAAEAVPLA